MAEHEELEELKDALARSPYVVDRCANCEQPLIVLPHQLAWCVACAMAEGFEMGEVPER